MPGPTGGGRSGGGGLGGLGGGRSSAGGFSSGRSFSGANRTLYGQFSQKPDDDDERPFGGHKRNGPNRPGGAIIFPIILIVALLYMTFSGGVADDLLYVLRNPGGSVQVQTAPYTEEAISVWYDDYMYTEDYTRTKLDDSLCKRVDVWYLDEANLFAYDEDAYLVDHALQYFYETTGVQPLLLTLDNIDGEHYPDWDTVDNFLYDTYVGMFGEDEGHYIFLYFSYADGDYTLYYIPGWDAVCVMDDYASEILMDNMEYYYQYSSTYAEMFAAAFIVTADTIMPQAETQPVDVSTTAPPASTLVNGEDTSEMISAEPIESDSSVQNDTSENVTEEVAVVTEESTFVIPSAVVSQEPDENQSHTPGADIGTQTFEDENEPFADIPVKKILLGGFGIVAVIAVFALVLYRNKKNMEELEKMT
ncbi:MAG: TPM domain-containing protein [Clostridia bacterium]|nr:TPM domain-containing protein [Clostridia bacterium]